VRGHQLPQSIASKSEPFFLSFIFRSNSHSRSRCSDCVLDLTQRSVNLFVGVEFGLELCAGNEHGLLHPRVQQLLRFVRLHLQVCAKLLNLFVVIVFDL
jgi:hypothetical protein